MDHCHTSHSPHSHSEHQHGSKYDLAILILAIACTLPLLVQMFHPIAPAWLQLILATIVQFVCGWTFYQGSFFSLKNWKAGMDLLIALGTSAAYFYSVIVFVLGLPTHLYFETSATIITLVLLGRYLEKITQKKALSAVEGLYKMQPKTAHVKREGEWKEISVDEMNVGDLFQVRPGERIPIDGVVVEGKSEVDESMLTGESLPVYKEAGNDLFMATQNGDGSLIAKATKKAQNTAFAHVVTLMKEATATRAPIQKTVDKVASVFVPLVLLFSFFTFLVWWLGYDSAKAGLINAVAVLVIACPCALGMATPIVILVGVAKGARLGILIKNVEALQTAEKLKMVAFDKTGTLTKGEFELIEVIPKGGKTKEEILLLAASMENYSEHPIAKVIAKAGKEKRDVAEFAAFPGLGVSGRIEGKNYYLGSSRFLETRGIKESYTSPGKTILALSDEREVLGYLVLQDVLRVETPRVIEKLREMKIETAMLTGDKKETALQLAQKAGISEVYAEVLPQDKVGLVRKLKIEKKNVAMVGDGINDAPALAASDCGFSMGGGSDIALRASDVTLMRNDLNGVPQAILLSKLTFEKVRQNLFFAFIYNIAAIPIAAFGWLNPMIAGFAMAASSLTVVLNALLLSRKEI